MAYARSALRLFTLANRAYIGATVTFFTVDPVTLLQTTTKATLYAGPTGGTLLANPVVLDSDGKLPQPVYIAEPVIAQVSGTVADHVTGIIAPVQTLWRGDWTSGTTYYPDDVVRDGASGNNLKDIWVSTGYHISTTWAADLLAGRWSLMIDVASTVLPPGALTLPIPIADGGTASTNAADARTALGVPSIPVAIAEGGTGQTSAANARAALGVPGLPVAIAEGGTGQATAPLARAALGAAGLADANQFSGANVFDNAVVRVRFTDDGATGPQLTFEHVSTSPAVNDLVAVLNFNAKDNLGAIDGVAQIDVIYDNVTSGAEAARFRFRTMQAGVRASRVHIGAGIYTEGVTGGDKGAGTGNFGNLFIGNQQVGLAVSFATLLQQSPSGTDGGSTVATTWTKMPLSTRDDPDGFVTFDAANDWFDLAAGTYEVIGWARFNNAGGTPSLQTRLQDTTGGTTIKLGTSIAKIANGVDAVSYIAHRFTIGATKRFEWQYWSSTAEATFGLGRAASTGSFEIYRELFIRKIG